MEQLIRTEAGPVLVRGVQLVRYGKSLSFQRYDEDGWPVGDESGWREQAPARSIADALTDIGLERQAAERTADTILRDWEPRWDGIIPSDPRGPFLAVVGVFGLAALAVIGVIALVVWLIAS